MGTSGNASQSTIMPGASPKQPPSNVGMPSVPMPPRFDDDNDDDDDEDEEDADVGVTAPIQATNARPRVPEPASHSSLSGSTPTFKVTPVKEPAGNVTKQFFAAMNSTNSRIKH